LAVLAAGVAALASYVVGNSGCNSFTPAGRCSAVVALQVYTATIALIAAYAAWGYVRRLLGRNAGFEEAALVLALSMIALWFLLAILVGSD
jgi:hypothetical protein